MASKSAQLWSVSYENESAFGEDTDTAGVRLRPVGQVDVTGLTFATQDIGIIRQYPSEAAENVRMPKGGSFSLDIPLTGLGSTAASAPAASALATLLGRVLGTTAAGLSTGDTCTGGTAAIPTTTGATGVTAGALVRIGAKGDARADGQWLAVGTHSGNNLNLLTAAPGAPAAADVLYCSRMVYPSETAGTFETVTSLRFELKSSMQQYLCHGCYPTAAELTGLNPGELPMVKITFAVAWWELKSETFPDSTSPDTFTPSPVVAGSFFFNVVGTATRSVVSIRKFSMNLALDNKPERGPGGVNEFQDIIGCNRGPAKCTISFTVDSEAAGTDTYGDLFDTSENSRVRRHALYSMSVGDGRALGLYFPNLKWIGNARQPQMNDDGVARKTFEMEATTGPTTTSDLTLSPWRLAMG
jgi:hypothetical protein